MRFSWLIIFSCYIIWWNGKFVSSRRITNEHVEEDVSQSNEKEAPKSKEEKSSSEDKEEGNKEPEMMMSYEEAAGSCGKMVRGGMAAKLRMMAVERNVSAGTSEK